MSSPSPIRCLIACALISGGHGAITVTDVEFSVPATGNNGSLSGTSASSAFVDDIFLTSLTTTSNLGPARTFTVANGEVVVGVEAIVRSGAQHVNAEFGDQDTAADGNPNPFAEVGIGYPDLPVPLSVSESTDPAIQNAAISEAVASYSLTQGVDGEGPAYTFDVLFETGVVDNDAGADGEAEFVLFERGYNSPYNLRAIIGGTKENPIYSAVVVVPVSAQTGTGIYIDTNEIGGGQELAAFAVDASDFGIAEGQAIYGLSITSTGGGGADITAQFITASVEQQTSSPFVPEPSTGFLGLMGGVILISRRRRRAS
ncbi:MAG: exosortase-dependent surface protein XDP2 [Verrucomicrobiota bacterium]